MVFSDSHSSFSNLDYAISYYLPERIFGLGDYEASEYELEKRGIMGVRGNSYFDPDLKYDHIFELYNFKILLTHGHTHSVRGGLLSLKLFAKEKNADIVFYGHTHIARIDDEDHITFVNPGSITIPFYPAFPTIAIMDIDNYAATIKIVDAVTFTVYQETTIKKDGK